MLEELAVGVGVTRRVELTVVLPELPVAIGGGDVKMTEGVVMKVVFEYANAPLRKRVRREKMIWNLASILKVILLLLKRL